MREKLQCIHENQEILSRELTLPPELTSLCRRIRSQPMFIVHRHLLISFVLSGLLYLFTCFFYIVDGAPGDGLIFANHVSAPPTPVASAGDMPRTSANCSQSDAYLCTCS
ncbi:hypothetical protein ANCDUO_16660 [Ancylostoma duodenale]|uniref:Uncharacterized protein n=1 Tax=Ancylostoma duodenale TaxID=51022 RepID=A0A0C2G2U9_9BILA|nr:hypothetical protein ANCDUO_16660 [Ancylostoma duodenale]